MDAASSRYSLSPGLVRGNMRVDDHGWKGSVLDAVAVTFPVAQVALPLARVHGPALEVVRPHAIGQVRAHLQRFGERVGNRVGSKEKADPQDRQDSTWLHSR